MAINPQRLEDEYQFWATTDGCGKKVQDDGGDGGPRRGGKAGLLYTSEADDDLHCVPLGSRCCIT